MRLLSCALAGLAFPLTFAAPALAEPVPADCAALVALVQDFSGYAVQANPAGAVDGWCVLDGAQLIAARADQPDLKVDALRIKGTAEGANVSAVEMQAKGLRLVQGLGAKQLDERLQAMFRLQSAELQLRAGLNPEAGRLEIRGFALVLSGGTEVTLDADLAGASLSPLGVAAGRLTGLELHWKADGRLMRGLMEAVGVGMDDGLTGAGAIKAARAGLTGVIDALPGSLVSDDSRNELSGMAESLPEARGILRLSFQSDEGIGAADLLVAGLGTSLLDKTLASLFAGSSLQVDWDTGLQP